MLYQSTKLSALAVMLATLGCGSESDTTTNNDSTNNSSDDTSNSNQASGKMILTSAAFKEGEVIPEKHTGIGDDDVSPALKWSGAPEGTNSFAIICDDPDAPSREFPREEGPWVHWVIYNIPAEVSDFPEGVAHGEELTEPIVARQAKTDFEKPGYNGPKPPPGTGPHRYFFKIYALDAELELNAADANKASLLEAMKGHILDEGQLMGTFEVKAAS